MEFIHVNQLNTEMFVLVDQTTTKIVEAFETVLEAMIAAGKYRTDGYHVSVYKGEFSFHKELPSIQYSIKNTTMKI